MSTQILSIFTRTPLHVGCGSSVGAVDQPVVRERHTGYPVIPGSALKGVLADLWLEPGKDVEEITFKGQKVLVRVKGRKAHSLFGDNDPRKDAVASAGSLLVGEGKLLAFPVRSANKCWAWVTCPLVLSRFYRDVRKDNPFKICFEGEKVIAPEGLGVDATVVFEEYPLSLSSDQDATLAHSKVVADFKALAGDDVWKGNIAEHLAIVSNDVFAYFVQNACEIANHNRIGDVTGVVDEGALFSQENVPSEAMFYSVCNSKDDGDFDELAKKLEKQILQIGADVTTGLGWCSVSLKTVPFEEVNE